VTTIIVCTVSGVFLLWAAWWVYRVDKRHGKHRIITLPNTPPAVAAHHPLPKQWEGKGEYYDLDDEADLKRWRALADGPADGVTARPLPDLGSDTTRHTHRDPTTGRYTPRGKL